MYIKRYPKVKPTIKFYLVYQFNNYKSEAQEGRWSDKYRVAANITDYYIISKLIFLNNEDKAINH